MGRMCAKCGEVKPLQKFYKTRSTRTGKEYRRRRCKACDDATKAAWRLANPERVAAMRKLWRDAHPGHNRVQHKAWRDRNRAHVNQANRANELKRRYGLVTADVSVMLMAQGGLCAACGGPPDDQRPLLVDHDHITGAVRGLLCNSCNLTLGRSKESCERLGGLIQYLERNGSLTMPVNDSSPGLIRIT